MKRQLMEAFDMSVYLDDNSQGPARQLQLLSPVQLPNAVASVLVSSIVTDSRQVTTGALFLAMPGMVVDGRSYIDEAIHCGAAAIFAEAGGITAEQGEGVSMRASVPVVAVPRLSEKASDVAARFYDFPATKMSIVGVTGTNGKTTCSHVIAQLATALSIECGVIGTLGVGKPGTQPLEETGYTTPDAVMVQSCLAGLYASGCEMVSMEISSHALVQHRVSAVPVKIAVFTNLSRDHLDFHGDMQAYAEAKQLLFSHAGLETAVINADDEFGSKLIERVTGKVGVLSYSLGNQAADIYATDIEYALNGLRARVCTPWGEGELSLRMIGAFNLSNCLAAIAVMLAAGADFKKVLAALPGLSAVEGRMQILEGGGITAVVDYAHTPQALEAVLQTLRLHAGQKLWCVFGCGGDRDRGKRAEMGRIASELADCVVVTSDNPRTEPPAQIIDEILLGIDPVNNLFVEADREAAIQLAVSQAAAGDIVLVAGKGHERYQEINGDRQPFYDVEVVRNSLSRRRQ